MRNTRRLVVASRSRDETRSPPPRAHASCPGQNPVHPARKRSDEPQRVAGPARRAFRFSQRTFGQTGTAGLYCQNTGPRRQARVCGFRHRQSGGVRFRTRTKACQMGGSAFFRIVGGRTQPVGRHAGQADRDLGTHLPRGRRPWRRVPPRPLPGAWER